MSEKKIRIGLLSDYLSSEYSDNLVKGITTYCLENDLELLLFPIGDLNKTNSNFNNFQFSTITSLINSENLDGIVVAAGTLMHNISRESFAEYLKRFAPLKIVNIASDLPGIPSLEVDCKEAFSSLIQYLIDEQDCKKFGFMGVESRSDEVILRTEIFKDVIKKNGLSVEEVPCWKTDFSYASAYHALSEYKNEKGSIDLDAIVCLNDDLAYASMDFCTKRLNMNVPRDIIITGFDNLQRASFSSPTLTSVNQQIEFLSYSAARTLHQLIRGKKVPDHQTIRAKSILRQSTSKKKGVQEKFVGNSFISVDARTSKDFSNSFSVSEWYNRRSQILQAANYYTAMSPNTTVKGIGSVITNSLRAFGFQAAGVVAFENPIEMPRVFDRFPLPRKAQVLAGFDYECLFNTCDFTTPYYFNPNETLFPQELLRFPSCGTIATALFYENVHYGYLLLRLNNYDAGVYELIQKAISTQLKSSYDYTALSAQQNQMRRQNKKLDLIAHTDELTGLRNRRGFLDLGQKALNLSEEMQHGGLVVYCDMDGLKKINDTYGHESGDLAIKAQSQILNKSFRTNDVLGRLGGDEFALICPGLTEDKLEIIKENINKACKEWKKETKSKFDLSISMGAVPYPLAKDRNGNIIDKDGYKMETLLAMADNCLYLEKRSKKRRR